jgi:hypothetical protein
MKATIAIKQVRRLKLGQTRRSNKQNPPATMYQRVLDVLHEFGPDPATLVLRTQRNQIQIARLVRHHIWAAERNANMAISAFFVSEPVLLPACRAF